MNWFTAKVIRSGGGLPYGLRKGETCYVRKVKSQVKRPVIVLKVGLDGKSGEARFLRREQAKVVLELGEYLNDKDSHRIEGIFRRYMAEWRKREYDTANAGEEKCCVCGRPALEDYDDREDCPWCGSNNCGLRIQIGLDFISDHPS